MVVAEKKAKAKKRKATKGEALDEIRELLEKIEAAEEACEEAEIDLNEKREEAKTAKGVWLTRVSELRDLVRTRKRWAEEAKRQPLLNQAKKPAANGRAAANGDPGASVGETDESWKAMGLVAAAFKDNHQDALEAAGLRTLGDLQAKMNQHGHFWAKEVGVNERFRVPIEDAFNDYLMAFSKPATATPVAPAIDVDVDVAAAT